MLFPCAKCGGLSLPHAACPHCGHFAANESAEIVAWLMSIPAEQRAAAVAAEPEQNWPATIVRTYYAPTQSDAGHLYAQEAPLLALAGYHPTSQSWAEGRTTVGQVVAVGIFAPTLARNGYLTVTYSRTPPPAEARPMKRCPDCAEEVLADARVCRYCRHEFRDPA